ncbi:hypothetical protein OWM54_12220 [Myxococcus sp. MISCRS1]|nr:hypothetical protein [Myxococcus sp. MISCRS1]MCY0997902.1 hypothetical protein [Myxococcus sp. MISCRS1]
MDEGTLQDGLTTNELQELARLRREMKVLRELGPPGTQGRSAQAGPP